MTATSASEIIDIRMGRDSQRWRLVFESTRDLGVETQFTDGLLQLTISGLIKQPRNNFLPDLERRWIKSVQWQDNILKLKTRIRKSDWIGTFKIGETEDSAHRLILDWHYEKELWLKIKALDFSPVVKQQTEVKSLVIPEEKNPYDAIRVAIIKKDYDTAKQLLIALSRSQSAAERAYALEYLGVVYERQAEFDQARDYYHQFINEFSEHPAFSRVQQRLAALIGFSNLGQTRELQAATNRTRIKKKTYHRASVSTDYRTADTVDDLGVRRTTSSMANLDLDIRGNQALDQGLLKYQLSLGQFYDLESNNDEDSSQRLRYAYLGYESEQYGIQIGRQRSRGKGIFGRFDGMLLEYSMNESDQINLVLGAPVASSKVTTLDPERSFISISYDWDQIIDNLDLSMFALEQQIDGITDRQAVGGQFNYLGDGFNIFGLVDYDTFYAELNALLLSGAFTTESKSRFHWTLNQRKSPYISTRNALIGQSADSIEALRSLFVTDEEILDLAADRTLESRSASAQWDMALSEQFELSANVTWLDLSGAPASGGVAEIIEPGASVYYNISIRGRNMYSVSDSSLVGYRLSKLDTSDVHSIYIQSRYRWKSGWSVQAKLRYDDRDDMSGRMQQNMSPSMRIQYQTKSAFLYLDAGIIFYRNQLPEFREVTTDVYYLYLGYRHYF